MSSKIASLRTDLPGAQIPKSFSIHGEQLQRRVLRSPARWLLGSCVNELLFGAVEERSFPDRCQAGALWSVGNASTGRVGSTAQGAERGESRGGYWKGETSESLNPMDGIGMKKGREGKGGTKRQETEKV